MPTSQYFKRELIHDALQVWAPTWPRRVNRTQDWADDSQEAIDALVAAQENEYNRPFISTYSFPEGHTKDGNIPRIDTLFIDFDFEGGDYEPGSGNREAWRRDLSHLLVRARPVASLLSERGAGGWRAALSGHKGIHLFLDFPAIPHGAGEFRQFTSGLSEYANVLVEELSQATGIADLSDYVDVTSSDLGRLCRVPNTKHGGATESFGEDRYCVPVTMEQLAGLTVDDYERLTREPRPVPWDSRTPNSDVGDSVMQHVSNAEEGSRPTRYGGSSRDMGKVSAYRDRSNDNISVGDIKLLTSDRPCIWEFYKRDDKWDYGDQSHSMEIYCVRELIEKNIPINVMKEFFSNGRGYNEKYTERIIKEIIARDYNRFSAGWLERKAPEFISDKCALHKRISNGSL